MIMEALYRDIYIICKREIDFKKHKVVERTREILPQINELSALIMNRENFEVDDETYTLVQAQYMQIISEILQAIENEDEVLLFDTLAFGMLPFIKMFLPEGPKEEI